MPGDDGGDEVETGGEQDKEEDIVLLAPQTESVGSCPSSPLPVVSPSIEDKEHEEKDKKHLRLVVLLLNLSSNLVVHSFSCEHFAL